MASVELIPLPDIQEAERRPSTVKKTIYTLNIGNYAPEITEYTYPLFRHYAEKIGADFRVIDERKFPDFPLNYEKFQLYELGKTSDWNLYIDSDAFLHPNYFDPTEFLHKDTVLQNSKDLASNRYRDHYLLRDGRFIGSCNWFTVASNWCLDIWHPLEDLSLEVALHSIYPTWSEVNAGITPEHLIDDFVVSRNIARYGLKFTTNLDIMAHNGDKTAYFHHPYPATVGEKLVMLKEVLIFCGLATVKFTKLVEGITTRSELAWLAMQAKSYKNIVEIGSYLGRSTRALAEHCKGTVVAIDDFKGPRDIELDTLTRDSILSRFKENTGDLKNLQTRAIDHNELDKIVLDFVPDMIFIDGDHSTAAVTRDINWALSKIKSGGLLCGHDFDNQQVQYALASCLPKFHKYSTGDIWWAIVE